MYKDKLRDVGQVQKVIQKSIHYPSKRETCTIKRVETSLYSSLYRVVGPPFPYYSELFLRALTVLKLQTKIICHLTNLVLTCEDGISRS